MCGRHIKFFAPFLTISWLFLRFLHFSDFFSVGTIDDQNLAKSLPSLVIITQGLGHFTQASNEGAWDFIKPCFRLGFFWFGTWIFWHRLNFISVLCLIWPRCAEVTFLQCCDYRLFPQAKPRAGAQHHQVSEAHQVTLEFKFVNVFVLSLCLYVNWILYSYI